MLLLCYVFFQVPASRVAFCKDGEEVSSQNNLLGELTYYYSYAVSRGSSGNYSCGYETRESDNRVTRSQLSSAEHLNLIGKGVNGRVSTILQAMAERKSRCSLLSDRGNGQK